MHVLLILLEEKYCFKLNTVTFVFNFYSDFVSKTLESDRDIEKVLPIHRWTYIDSILYTIYLFIIIYTCQSM